MTNIIVNFKTNPNFEGLRTGDVAVAYTSDSSYDTGVRNSKTQTDPH